MQDTQAEAIEQEQAEAIEQEQAAAAAAEPEQHTVDPLFQAMADNFLRFCQNNAVAQGSPAGEVDGARLAIQNLIATAFNSAPEQGSSMVEALANGIGDLQLGGRALPEILMEFWGVVLHRQGRLNTVLGQVKDRAMLDQTAFVRHQFQQVGEALNAITVAPAAKPKKAAAKPKAH